MDNEEYQTGCSLIRELSLRWEELIKTKPPNLARKPTESEMHALRQHQDLVNEFLEQQVPPELSGMFDRKTMKSKTIKNNKGKGRKAVPPNPPKPPKIQLSTKPTPVALGWHPEEKFIFSRVIPFLSHVTRSAYQRSQDESEFGGINRCVFSNLFVDTEPLRIAEPDDAGLLGHGANYSEALCAESYYMAAKARDQWDSRFIIEELTTSYDVAGFGHNRLQLTRSQRDRLISFGAPPEDFLRVVVEQEECDTDTEDTRWLRGRDGVMPVRKGWREIRHNVFFYILRHKFGPNAPPNSVAKTTMDTLVSMVQTASGAKLPLLIEHRKRDSFWGDGSTGAGANVLGRILTQILLERGGLSSEAPLESWSEIMARVENPNSDLVRYHVPPGWGLQPLLDK